MKLSSYINRLQSDKHLSRNLRKNFSVDCVIVIENWSVANTKFQESPRVIGLIRALKKEGIEVFLIDEFKTSSICPYCNVGTLETFKDCKNSRLYRRQKNLTVRCHGLLRCNNKNCLESYKSENVQHRSRLWNRDLAAVLNFRHITFSLRKTRKRPVRFQRAVTSSAASSSKATKRKATNNNQLNKKPKSDNL